jgi:hypothetical protein
MGPINGPYLEGEGLETLHFKSQFPPKKGATLTSEPACKGSAPSPVSLTVTKCTPQGDGSYANCEVHVTTTNRICPVVGQAGSFEPPLVAVKGYWDGTGAWHADKNVVTFACDVNDPMGPPGSVNSDIGTCAQGGFWPERDGDKFLACVRAIRADYCGDGTPHTMTNTKIEVHDLHDPKRNPMTVALCEADDSEGSNSYEATWSKNGAVCIYHDRWYGTTMSDEICTGPHKPATGTACKQNDPDAIVSTRSACNVCTLYTGPPPKCGPDQDPVCAGVSHSTGGR